MDEGGVWPCVIRLEESRTECQVGRLVGIGRREGQDGGFLLRSDEVCIVLRAATYTHVWLAATVVCNVVQKVVGEGVGVGGVAGEVREVGEFDRERDEGLEGNTGCWRSMAWYGYLGGFSVPWMGLCQHYCQGEREKSKHLDLQQGHEDGQLALQTIALA